MWRMRGERKWFLSFSGFGLEKRKGEKGWDRGKSPRNPQNQESQREKEAGKEEREEEAL